jgi:hypothetical protein
VILIRGKDAWAAADADLQAQLAEWHREVNTARASRATGIIPAVRLAEEQPRLRPLKIAPADLALRVPVGRDAGAARRGVWSIAWLDAIPALRVVIEPASSPLRRP